MPKLGKSNTCWKVTRLGWVSFRSWTADLLASLGKNGAVIFWRTDIWAEVLSVEKIGEAGILANLAVHPTLPAMAACGSSRNEINVWNLDLVLLRGAEPATPTVFYVNAKAVLLGESSVGKSGLGIRIAEGAFRQTESTHGAQFWHFPTERLPALPPNVQAELTLWDLAGQPEYRLTHQPFLDDTDAALLLFDCSDANDPFRGVPYWAKALKKHAPNARKFLVSARCDVSPVTVDRPTINRALATHGLDEHFKTSAKTGEGVKEVFQRLMSEIPWDKLPRTSTPKLFQVVREFLLERKQAGANLLGMEEVRRATAARFTEHAAAQAEWTQSSSCCRAGDWFTDWSLAREWCGCCSSRNGSINTALQSSRRPATMRWGLAPCRSGTC